MINTICLLYEECLQWIELAKKYCSKDKKVKKIEKSGFAGALAEIALYFKKGERYKRKEETINKWIEKDKASQDKFDNAITPDNVFCDQCNFAMKIQDKTLHESWNENSKMLFFFECPNCHKRKGVFENGEVYNTQKNCPDCGSILESTHSRKGEVVTIVEKCKNCSYKYKDVWDFKADDEKSKKEKERRKYLLNNYRKVFCLSKEDGDKYISSQASHEFLEKRMEEQKKKNDDPRYQKAKALKKIKVFDMEKLLKEAIEKDKYVNLSFDKPEITKDVIIPFSVQESDTSRCDYDSQNNLKKLIKKTLEDTNWRLMSDGISQRLGILTGRIRGYENEEDLVKIFSK